MCPQDGCRVHCRVPGSITKSLGAPPSPQEHHHVLGNTANSSRAPLCVWEHQHGLRNTRSTYDACINPRFGGSMVLTETQHRSFCLRCLLGFIVYFAFVFLGGHPWQYSELTPSCIFRDHSSKCSGDPMGGRGRKPSSHMQGQSPPHYPIPAAMRAFSRLSDQQE